MGFLDRIKSKHKDSIPTEWNHLTELEQLDEVLESSHTKPVVLFKHSTTCGISASAQHRLMSGWDELDKDAFDFYYLDLLTYRPVSNAVADKTSVVHQSPQIVIVKNGQAVYNSSHHSINTTDIARVVADLG